jgi:hypothetical protein
MIFSENRCTLFGIMLYVALESPIGNLRQGVIRITAPAPHGR